MLLYVDSKTISRVESSRTHAAFEMLRFLVLH
jgi:hypothetical protein